MSTVQSQPLIQSSDDPVLKRWIIRHPVVTYFVLAYAMTWGLQLPMILGRDGFGFFPFLVPLPIYAILFIASSYAGPTGAAVYVTSLMEGKDGLRRFFRRYGEWRVGLPWYLCAFFGFPVIYLFSASIFMGAETLSALTTHWQTFFTTYLPALLIFPAFITWGEEPGWRGFALTRLEEKYSPLTSSVIVGLLHGIWHLPIFIMVQGPSAAGPFNLTYFVINTIGIMIISIIWTWIFNNSKQSILMAVLLHSSSNATGAFIHVLLPHFPKQAGYVTTVIYIILAVTLLITTRGRLSYSGLATKNVTRER